MNASERSDESINQSSVRVRARARTLCRPAREEERADGENGEKRAPSQPTRGASSRGKHIDRSFDTSPLFASASVRVASFDTHTHTHTSLIHSYTHTLSRDVNFVSKRKMIGCRRLTTTSTYVYGWMDGWMCTGTSIDTQCIYIRIVL